MILTEISELHYLTLILTGDPFSASESSTFIYMCNIIGLIHPTPSHGYGARLGGSVARLYFVSTFA